MNVIMPIITDDLIIIISIKEKDIPITKASILVAIDKRNNSM